MKILISFCNQPADAIASNLFFLDVESGEGKYLLETKDSFTGLAQDCDFFYALSQNSNTEIVIIDKKSKETILRQKLDGLTDAHSIAIDKNIIYAVSTGKDRVLKYRFDREKMIIILEKTLWMPDDSAGESDTHHINSLFLHKNNLYISAFGLKKNERWSSADDGYIFNITKNKKEIHGIYHPHSVFIENSLIFGKIISYCESSTRSIWKNKRKVIKLESGYVRGLSIDGKYLLFGTSSGRKVSRNDGLVNNPADLGELEDDCRVIVFKKKFLGGYEKLKEFSFLPKHKEIYDIMIIK